MTECEEVATSIWLARTVSHGNGLNITAPIRTRRDAELVADHYCGDQTGTVVDEVAAALYRMVASKPST